MFLRLSTVVRLGAIKIAGQLHLCRSFGHCGNNEMRPYFEPLRCQLGLWQIKLQRRPLCGVDTIEEKVQCKGGESIYIGFDYVGCCIVVIIRTDVVSTFKFQYW